MSFTKPTAAEIDQKLREDFRRRLRDFGVTAETADPVLSVLFRTLAGQLEALYGETERIRLALLDELMAGLGIEPRVARPAQTVVRFVATRGAALVDAGTELLGEAESGERITFSTDAAIAASPARIALAAIYQDHHLRLLPGVPPSDAFQAVRPSLEPVRVALGPAPALFLAIENLPESHLGQHALFFEVSPYATALQQALLSEPWCLARADSAFTAEGILRPQRSNAGVRQLQWLLPDRESTDDRGESELPELPDGFYAGRCFVFPVIPPARRQLCGVPRGLDTALPRLFALPSAELFGQPRAWVRIGLPAVVGDLAPSLSNILLHAVSASNLELLNETIHFSRHGTSVPVSRDGSLRHLVAPLSIIGESDVPYRPELEAFADPGVGRYAVRNGRIHLQPARRTDEDVDQYVNLRLWVTQGVRGNHVGPGKVHAFLRRGADLGLQIGNPTAAAGGTDGENQAEAQKRFSHVLLSRERIVTRTDLLAAVRAFDRRVEEPQVASELRRTSQGLQRVHLVRATVRRDQFVDFEWERRILQEELTRFLQDRALFDVPLVVELQEAA